MCCDLEGNTHTSARAHNTHHTGELPKIAVSLLQTMSADIGKLAKEVRVLNKSIKDMHKGTGARLAPSTCKVGLLKRTRMGQKWHGAAAVVRQECMRASSAGVPAACWQPQA